MIISTAYQWQCDLLWINQISSNNDSGNNDSDKQLGDKTQVRVPSSSWTWLWGWRYRQLSIHQDRHDGTDSCPSIKTGMTVPTVVHPSRPAWRAATWCRHWWKVWHALSVCGHHWRVVPAVIALVSCQHTKHGARNAVMSSTEEAVDRRGQAICVSGRWSWACRGSVGTESCVWVL